MDRRKFLINTGLASAAISMPSFLKASLPLGALPNGSRKLVIIQLGGGNDSLNTVVPFGNDLYYQNRPKIGLRNEELIKIIDSLGFNSQLKGLANLYNKGYLSVIQCVGYPEPNRSHFRSMEIWQSASKSDEFIQTGWLGRYLDFCCDGVAKPYHAIEINDSLGLTLKGEEMKGIAMSNAKKLKSIYSDPFIKNQALHDHDHDHEQVSYLRKTLAESSSSVDYLYEKSKIYTSTAPYPANKFARKLKLIAELITSGSDTRIYYVNLNGFDTHANQKGAHGRLLEQLGSSLEVFINDLKANNALDETAVMCFSEFGRRVKQNAANGTDHGTAGNVFLLGSKLNKPGFVGEEPDLKNLDKGDLIYKIDFRSIYQSLLDDWLGTPSSQVISSPVETLRLF